MTPTRSQLISSFAGKSPEQIVDHAVANGWVTVGAEPKSIADKIAQRALINGLGTVNFLDEIGKTVFWFNAYGDGAHDASKVRLWLRDWISAALAERPPAKDAVELPTVDLEGLKGKVLEAFREHFSEPTIDRLRKSVPNLIGLIDRVFAASQPVQAKVNVEEMLTELLDQKSSAVFVFDKSVAAGPYGASVTTFKGKTARAFGNNVEAALSAACDAVKGQSNS